MKLTLLVLISFNLYAASLVDHSVSILQELNGENQEETIDTCAEPVLQNECERTSDLNTAKLEKYLKCPDGKAYNRNQLEQFLQEDKTDERDYIPLSQSDENWFVCQHFSTQSFMRSSCHANQEYTKAYEEHTKITINDQESSLKNSLPTFYLSINCKSCGFYHAINAIFIGDTVEEMGDISNYILYEPQSDELYYSVDELRQKWKSYNMHTATDLKLKISVMEEPGYTTDGSLQFRTKELAAFDCSNLSN